MHFQTNRLGNWSQTWWIHSLWYSLDLINFWTHCTDLPLFLGLWLVEQFLCMSGQTAQGIDFNLCGYICYGTPQAWWTFGYVPQNFHYFVAADWSSSFCAFADKLLIRFSSKLMGLPWPSPCGCGDISVRLGSRIGPHRHRVVVEVHWRGAQGWRSISWVVATFNHVGGSFDLFMAATGDVWIIPSFRIWGYVLHVEHISCVITNCGQHQWAIPSLFSIVLLALLEKNITRKLLSLSLDLFFKILLFQVAFLIFFSTAIFSPYFLQVGLLLQYVALFQSGN